MSERDLFSQARLQMTFPAAAAKTADANGLTVDRRGFSNALLAISHETHDNGTTDEFFGLYLQHSDDDSSWADITLAQTQYALNDSALTVAGLVYGGTAAFGALAARADVMKRVNLAGLKRYVRLRADIGGTTPSDLFTAAFVLNGKYKASVN